MNELVDDAPIYVDAAFVIQCLEDASKTLAALPHAGFSTALAQWQPDILREFSDLIEPSVREDEEQSLQQETSRPDSPARDKIDAMDDIFLWLRYVKRRPVRRIVALRSITSRVTEKPMSWRKIGERMNLHHDRVKRWHDEGVCEIAAALNRLSAKPTI